jgi:hypothetical protein
MPILENMAHIKGQTGSRPDGVMKRETTIAVNRVDKELLVTYRALLDNPCTRDAAIDALELVKQLDSQLC